MRRVVITGTGIVCSIGVGKEDVTNSLKKGLSGIEFSEEYQQINMRSNVFGNIPTFKPSDFIDRKNLRFMGDAAIFSTIAMQEAIRQAKLTEKDINNEKTGLIVGSGGASTSNIIEACDILRKSGVKRVGPYRVTRTMGSTTSACLAIYFKIKGVSYSISSACATSAHCIGNAFELIASGKQDIMFTGGGEELHWSQSLLFDAMGALSQNFNSDPKRASRAFDKDRDGFVISGGGGILVLEELTHAQNRGANIIAELVGYSATSDGFDMVQPSGCGAIRCMNNAISDIKKPIDYINTHGTSTPVGDVKELEAIKKVFGKNVPKLSSTKSLTGHSLGAAGANEAIFSLLMLENNFIAPSINIDNLDERAKGLPIITATNNTKLNTVMSNSFGFGGTNACLVFSKL